VYPNCTKSKKVSALRSERTIEKLSNILQTVSLILQTVSLGFVDSVGVAIRAGNLPSRRPVKHVLRFNARLREGMPEVEVAMFG
jgi:ribosomal protein L1